MNEIDKSHESLKKEGVTGVREQAVLGVLGVETSVTLPSSLELTWADSKGKLGSNGPKLGASWDQMWFGSGSNVVRFRVKADCCVW